MLKVSYSALALAVVSSAFGAVIDISTGTGNAAWQVLGPGTGFANVSAVDVTGFTNSSWAPAPAGSSWVSWGQYEGVSCTASGTGPANHCASPSVSTSTTFPDVWQYSLTVTAAQLAGSTSGTLNFIFGSDNRVNVVVGSEPLQNAGGSAGNGYSALSCSATGGATTIVGNNYAGCTTTIAFTAADLVAGALTITAYDFNDPISPSCPACGNPTGFILDGTLSPTAPVGPPMPPSGTPEPASFVLVGSVGLIGAAVLRRKRQSLN